MSDYKWTELKCLDFPTLPSFGNMRTRTTVSPTELIMSFSQNGLLKTTYWVSLSSETSASPIQADSRLTFFITHGGVGSTFEGAARGIPLAMFPLFGDQMRNARMTERNGFGIVRNATNSLLLRLRLLQIRAAWWKEVWRNSKKRAQWCWVSSVVELWL